MGLAEDRLDLRAKYIHLLCKALVADGRTGVEVQERNGWDDHLTIDASDGSGVVRCLPDTADIYGPWSYVSESGVRLAAVIDYGDDPSEAIAAIEGETAGG